MATSNFQIKSVKPGDAAADRKCYAFTTTTAAPTLVTDGFELSGSRYAHVIPVMTVGVSLSIKVWLWHAISETWQVWAGLGNNGTISLLTADDDEVIKFEHAGADRIAVQCSAHGAGGELLSVWIGRS